MAKHEGSEFVWFLAGIAIGLAGALLTAPQAGEETRRQLREQAARGRERLREAGRNASERGRELVDEAGPAGRTDTIQLSRGAKSSSEAVSFTSRAAALPKRRPPNSPMRPNH